MEPGRLSRTTLLCYSSGSIVETSIYGFLGLYLLNFYTDVVHLDPRLIGYAFGIRFCIDAIADPVVGYLSDRTKSRFGRRRPYFWSAFPAAILFCLLLVPPNGSEAFQFVYLTAVSTALILALTVFGIPYMALSWELTTDYNERTRISVYRRVFEVVAEMLATLTIPILLAVAATSTEQVKESEWYPTAAFVLAIVTVVAATIAFVGTPEKQPAETSATLGFLDGVRAAYRNKPFVILLIAFTLVAVADRVATSLLFYLLEYLHGVRKQDASSLFLAFFAGSLTSPPLWFQLSKRLGKKQTYIAAILSWGCAFALFVLTPWSHALLHLIVGLMGAASSGVLVLPGAIIPDVIEWEQNRTGSRLEGTFSGLAKFSWQFATGACFFVVGHLLYATGYDGETPPTERILEGLRIMFIALPGVLLLAAIAVFSRFPITPEIYEQLVDRPNRDDDVSRS